MGGSSFNRSLRAKHFSWGRDPSSLPKRSIVSRPTFLALLRPLCIHDNVRNEADHGRDAGAGAAGSAIDGMTRAKDVADQVAVHVQRSHVAKHVSKGKCCKVRFTCLGKLQEYNPSLSHEVACRHTSAMNEDECRITRSFCFPFSPRLY
ncbi:unnamed protein product [Polarella glacialis]|uniref:Uncharacterized protein n=1 Tax=Polarella glacialis TaxID=89957 RepID=A0A813H231_POLGL|nr:unnamed protein product [Polarella glacialis]